MVHFAQMAFGAGTHARIPADLSGQADLLIPHVAADVILAGSYLVVLGGLIWFLRRRPDLVRDHWLLGLLIGCFLAVIAVARLADAI